VVGFSVCFAVSGRI